MENNPYNPYNQSPPNSDNRRGRFIAPTADSSASHRPNDIASATGRGQFIPPNPTAQKRTPAMPKAQALALLLWLKRGLVIASIAGFSAISALVASHAVGVTANANTTAPSTTQPSQPAQQPGDNNFFNQQGGSNFGSGNSSNAPQFPNTGTTVS